MRCIDLEQFNAEKDVPSMGVHAQIYPARESEVKVRSVYLIYQRYLINHRYKEERWRQ